MILVIISKYIKTQRTDRDIIRIRETGTLGNEIPVNFVGKPAATKPTTAVRRQKTGAWKRRECVATTAGMGKSRPLRDEIGNGIVEIQRDNTVVAQ